MFFGWKVLGATVLTQALQAGLLIYGFGVIILPLEDALGASRQSLMFATVLLSLASNIISPFAGTRVDQAEVRRLMLLGLLLLGAGFVALSQIRATWQLLAVFALLMPGANLLLGQLTASALMTRWFRRLRGRALGLSALGTSVGGLLFPPLLARVTELLGWRQAYLAVGLGAVLLALPVIWRWVRDRPGALGLAPDGDPAPAAAAATAPRPRWSTRQILTAPLFWQIGVIMGLVLAVYMALLANLVPHATDQGVSPTRASLLIAELALLAMGGKLFFGLLADRLELRLALWGAMALMAAGIAGLAVAASLPGMALACLPLGLAAGGLLPIWGALVARGFGPDDYGRALGWINPVMMPFTFTAPPATGRVYDLTGSYELAFLAFLAALGVAALLLLGVRLPGPAAA